MTSSSVDLALTGGHVLTCDAQFSTAEAVAISGTKTLAVGSNEYVESLSGKNTAKIELNGKTVLPGFIDSHVHFDEFATHPLLLKAVPCSDSEGVQSIEDMISKLREYAVGVPKGEWVIGTDYDPIRLREKRHPERKDLDLVSKEHPVAVRHKALLNWSFNTAGLKLLEVNESTPNPPGGMIRRDEKGELTGVISYSAIVKYIKPRLLKYTVDDLARGYEKACKMMNSFGITSAADAALKSAEELRAWQELRSRGSLTVRMNLMVRDDHIDAVERAGFLTGFGDEWLRMGPIKLGIDGSGMLRTAALSNPYEGEPHNYGEMRMSVEEVQAACERAHTLGYQLTAHAVGDRAIACYCEGLERAQAGFPRPALRHRVEHCSLVNEELINRICALGLMLSIQPSFLHLYGDDIMSAWGSERLKYYLPLKTFMKRGILLAAGSDYPATPLDPFIGMSYAIGRGRGQMNGGEGFCPEEGLDFREALTLYTINGACITGEGNLKGSIEPGKLADLVVVDNRLEEPDSDSILRCRVLLTVSGGKIVFGSL